jgi:hypothetical protein
MPTGGLSVMPSTTPSSSQEASISPTILPSPSQYSMQNFLTNPITQSAITIFIIIIAVTLTLLIYRREKCKSS